MITPEREIIQNNNPLNKEREKKTFYSKAKQNPIQNQRRQSHFVNPQHQDLLNTWKAPPPPAASPFPPLGVARAGRSAPRPRSRRHLRHLSYLAINPLLRPSPLATTATTTPTPPSPPPHAHHLPPASLPTKKNRIAYPHGGPGVL